MLAHNMRVLNLLPAFERKLRERWARVWPQMRIILARYDNIRLWQSRSRSCLRANDDGTKACNGLAGLPR